MSGRLVLLAIAALLGLAGWYMWAISMPVKREARRQRAAERPAPQPGPERVQAPSASAPLAPAVSARRATMVSAWMDPRAADALGDLVRPGRPQDAPTPGLDSPEWLDVVMRAPYSAVQASPGERTKSDANLRAHRSKLDALFSMLAAGQITPAEALIRYRELELARTARDREIFGAARAERLEALRESAYQGLAAPGAERR